MRLPFILLFCLLSTFTSQAQIFGDEWINFEQQYYKFQIGEEGLYRLSYESLKNAGLPLSSIDPRGLQIFWRGEEQHIWVEGQDDGGFDPGDYMLFYGTYNDGKLDTELYRSPNEQPHAYMSLYQDSSVYFITWNNNSTGKRITKQAPQDFNGLTAAPWYMHEEVMWFRNQWFDGAPFADLGFYSEYTDGEGWMSSNVTGGYRSYSLQTPFYDATGPQATAYVLAYGKSDPTNPGDFDPEGNNHEFEVSVGWGNTLRVLATQKHRGYSRLEFEDINIPANAIGNTTRFNFRSIFGAKGRHAVSLIKLSYPRKFDLEQSALKIYEAGTGNNFYEWKNYLSTNTTPMVIDWLTKEKLYCELNNSVLRYKRSATQAGLVIIADSARVPDISDIRSVSFVEYDFSQTNHNYIIISHSSLDSGAQAYKSYRESSAGGQYDVLVAHADQLYDQFYYGIHHPLAIRRLNLKINQQQSNAPEYLLLLGRGQLYSRITTNAINRNLADLVPTFGIPASDYLLAINPDVSNIVATCAVGRLPAKNNTDISHYLEKLKAWDQNLKQTLSWGKQVLHLVGGLNQAESSTFQSYLKNVANRVEADSFNGQVRTITKEVSEIDKSLTEIIINEVNKGVSIMTYFGHGSALILELDIGDVQQYDNYGKTPFFHFNGCVLGNTFEISSLAEGFLFTENKGALGWLAGSSFGFTSELANYSRIFYDELLLKSYGMSVGQAVEKAMANYAKPNNPYNRAMCAQYLYHGDPALLIYTPTEPDFTFPSKNAVKNNLSNRSSKDNIEIEVSILNQGKFYEDTLEVKVHRKSFNGQEETTLFQIIPDKFTNLLRFSLPPNQDFKGVNNLLIELDPLNEIGEFGPEGESNNRLSYQFFLPTEGIQIISPQRNQIVSNTQVELKVQLDDLSSNEREIIFQLDTTPDFNSAFLKTQRTQGDFIITASFSLLPIDSIDYYWRASINDEEPVFESSQFAFIYDSEGGFAQNNPKSFESGVMEDLFIDSASKKFEFGNILSETYAFDTYGGLGRSARSIRMGGPRVHLGTFNGIGIWVLALDPINENRFIYPSPFALKQPTDAVSYGYPWLSGNPYYDKGAYSGMYQFNTSIQEYRDSLVAHLNRIPDKFHVYIINGRQTGIELWEDTVFNKLKEFGIIHLKDRVKELYPFGLKGQKGIAPGEALEFYPDINDPVNPPESQAILNSTSFPVKKVSGTYETEQIGPSLNWNEAYVQAVLDSDDRINIDVIGIDQQNREFVLMQNIPGRTDLSGISAGVYPYLKLRMTLYDSIQRSPAQLNRWIVTFKAAGDATIGKMPQQLNLDTLVMGAQIVFPATFLNINHSEYNSVPVALSMTDENGSSLQTINDTIQRLAATDTLHKTYSFDTDGLSGNYNIQLLLNPNNSPLESNLTNNQYARNIFVAQNESLSPLEIKVDGRFITYGELVSSHPVIDVSWLQTDSFYYVKDVNDIQLSLKYPNADTFIRLNPISEDLSLTAPTQIGQPYLVRLRKALSIDGEYTIRAEVEAPHNKKLMKNEATFSIISESSISEVFNYPNPFVTDTRFVFTLTGAEPVDVAIDIYNISGRKVKQIILPAEDLQIGQNLTDYRWDGTDEFGDQLANGVYLFKIKAINSSGIMVKERQLLEKSKNTQFFQNGFGKMYLAK